MSLCAFDFPDLSLPVVAIPGLPIIPFPTLALTIPGLTLNLDLPDLSLPVVAIPGLPVIPFPTLALTCPLD